MMHFHDLSAGSLDDKIDISRAIKVAKPVAKRAAKCTMIIGTAFAFSSLGKLATDGNRRAEIAARAKVASDAVAELKKAGIEPQVPREFRGLAYALLWLFAFSVADQIMKY